MKKIEDYSNIISNIERYVDLSEEDKRQLVTVLTTRSIKKKQFIVKPGEVCTHQTYVAAGAFRSYLIDEKGNEHTIQFAVEDWFISDFNSYINRSPASLYVESIEDSLIHQISYAHAEQLCEKNPKFERFFRLVAQKSFAFAQKRVLSNLGLNAEERYLEFYEMYPNIVNRVPQYALASYLGMSAEFLSKTRKKILEKK